MQTSVKNLKKDMSFVVAGREEVEDGTVLTVGRVRKGRRLPVYRVHTNVGATPLMLEFAEDASVEVVEQA